MVNNNINLKKNNYNFPEMNDALIKIVQERKKIDSDLNNQVISDHTKIDKSSVSLHLSGKRKINIDDALNYAKYFDVPLIRILDDKVVKYPIVAYGNKEGEVLMRKPNQNEIVVCPNLIQSTNCYAIYNDFWQSIHWYEEDKSTDVIDPSTMINDLCYIIGKKGHWIGEIRDYNPKTKNITYYSLHTAKNYKDKLIIAYPILDISKLKYHAMIKIKNIL